MQLQKPGAVGILPTDTVYGLVARASDQSAVARLYRLKHREHKPGTIIAASIDQLVELGLKYRYLKAVEQFWPGAVSVIIPCGPDLDYLHQGLQGLAVRITAHDNLRELLQQTGALLTSSANQPGNRPLILSQEPNAFLATKSISTSTAAICLTASLQPFCVLLTMPLRSYAKAPLRSNR